MSYWDSKVFSRIYRKWQKRISRHPDHYFQTPIEYAKKEFFALQDTLKMTNKPLTPKPRATHCVTDSNFNVLGFKSGKTFKKDLEDRVIEQIKEEIPEDPIIHIGAMVMRQSEWEEIKRVYQGGTIEEKTRICAEHAKRKEYRLLKAEFMDGEED